MSEHSFRKRLIAASVVVALGTTGCTRAKESDTQNIVTQQNTQTAPAPFKPFPIPLPKPRSGDENQDLNDYNSSPERAAYFQEITDKIGNRLLKLYATRDTISGSIDMQCEAPERMLYQRRLDHVPGWGSPSEGYKIQPGDTCTIEYTPKTDDPFTVDSTVIANKQGQLTDFVRVTKTNPDEFCENNSIGREHNGNYPFAERSSYWISSYYTPTDYKGVCGYEASHGAGNSHWAGWLIDQTVLAQLVPLAQ